MTPDPNVAPSVLVVEDNPVHRETVREVRGRPRCAAGRQTSATTPRDLFAAWRITPYLSERLAGHEHVEARDLRHSRARIA